MAKSGVRGFDVLERKLRYIADAANFEMDAANLDNARTLQRHVVPRVPVNTGRTRSAFADPSAVRVSRKHAGGYVYGLTSKYLKRLGYRAKWIEFGTKGYAAGDVRTYEERGRRGKVSIRKYKIKRTIPARPAQPFFRPGIEAARKEIEARWREGLARAVRARSGTISAS